MRARNTSNTGVRRRANGHAGPRLPQKNWAALPLAVICFGALAMAGYAAGRIPPGESAAAQAQPAGTHIEATRAALAEGDVERACLEVKLALQDNPFEAKSHFLFGCLLEMRGEHDQAVVAFERALALDSANSEALYNLGTELLRRREGIPASRLLENAVMVRPDHVPSWNNLAKAYFLSGLPELTVAAYEEALRRDPSNAVALKNLQLLAEASGLQDAAATYRRRLGTLPAGHRTGPGIETEDPPAQVPTWPTAAGQANPPAPAQSTAARASEPGASGDAEAADLQDLLRDLPNVKVERRGGQLTLTGWTSNARERALLDRILGRWPEIHTTDSDGKATKPTGILDLTGDDTGDPQRMIEIDAVIFALKVLNNKSVGFNLLETINFNFNYFASDHQRAGTGYAAPPSVTGDVLGLSQWGWIFSASVEYAVNIANTSEERVAVLARPHLTALSGTTAKFLTGGELVYQVSGLNSGDIKPYPFGTSLIVTLTLLRTPDSNGNPRIHVVIQAERTSALSILASDNRPTMFDKITVTSEAILPLGKTLILSGLNQREKDTTNEGVPVLMDIPLLKYVFSKKTNLESNAAVIVLLTPRDPAYIDEQNRKAVADFIEMRRAFLKSRQGAPEDMQRFRERYPNWDQLAPSRFATHIFLLENSELYRAVRGEELGYEGLDLELLGPKTKK